jgi:hypothetical protein
MLALKAKPKVEWSADEWKAFREVVTKAAKSETRPCK